MTTLSSHTLQPGQPLTPERRAEVLQELVDTATASVNRQLDAFANRVVQFLESRAALGDRQAASFSQAAALLKKNRYPFCYLVSEKLTTSLHTAVQLLGSPNLLLTAPTTATMAPEMEVDKRIRLLKAGRAVEAEHAERFAALNQRLGHLLGNPDFDASQNPFRPGLFLLAVHDAWCEFEPDASQHAVLYPLLGPELCLDMGSVAHALNAALIRRGILPTVSEQARPMRTATAASAADPLSTRLRQLFPAGEAFNDSDKPLPGAFPTLLDDTRGPNPAAARQAVLSTLQTLLKADLTAPTPNAELLLARLKQRMTPQTLTAGDAVTLDLMIAIFRAVLQEPHLPGAIKVVIAQLQAPLLKLTLTDREFFFDARHPARRVVELLAALGVEWNPASGPDDPVYQTILRSVKRLLSDPRPGMLRDVVAALDEQFAARAEQETQALAAPIEQATEQARLLQAKRVATHEVALRIGTGEVVAFVETFLEDRWVPVLTLAYARKDDDPQGVENALATMDDLCWSVKPKITPDERKELVAKLPYIVNNLNRWLNTIEWNEAERLTFFNELARCHASIVRAPLELSPERQLLLSMKVAKRAAERRQERLAKQTPERAPDDFDRQVDQLARGTWIEFLQKNGVTVRVRLAWISPPRNLYLFATRENTEAFSLSDEELAQALRDGRARIVLEAGLVGRALAQAVGDAANGELGGLPFVA